jgi:hypothetical protein
MRSLSNRRANIFLCRATPSDLLYEYRMPDSPLWTQEQEYSAGVDVVLAGHTPSTLRSDPWPTNRR